MNKLENCINEVVERGFPELVKTKISAEYKKMDEAYFEFERNSQTNYKILVDKNLRNVKRKIILGGLSHEASHILKEIRLNPIQSFFEGILYNLSARYRSKDERETDILAIERGFGKELLEFVKYADKRRKKYTKEDGLTKKEIKRIVRHY